MSRILISAAAILLIAGMFFVARPKFQNPTKGHTNTPDQVTKSTAGSDASTQDLSVPSRTKSRNRIVHRKPTQEETKDLLRNTIIPHVDIEDLSVGEAANKIRLLIQEAGIEPHELQIICDMTAPISEMRIEELRLRNIPLAVILRYMCDSTKLIYRVSTGVLEFTTLSEEPIEVGPYDWTDPFSDPSSANPPLDPDDPFSGTSREKEEPDPFAEP